MRHAIEKRLQTVMLASRFKSIRNKFEICTNRTAQRAKFILMRCFTPAGIY